MSFGSPSLLLTLVFLPLGVIGYATIDRRRRLRAEKWTSPAMLPNLVESRTQRLRHLPPLLLLVALALLLVGFARPERDLGTITGAAPVLVLDFDVSGSMAATDLGPPRVLVAHRLAEAMVRALPSSDRVAIVSFGNLVHLLASPTLDRGTALAAIPSEITPLAGTRIGDAINEGVSVAIEASGKGYPGEPSKPGVIVLFSDGGQTAGGPSPASAANTAYLDGIPVDTVAIGTSHGTVTQDLHALDQTVPTTFSVAVAAAAMRNVAHLSAGTFVAVDSASSITSATRALSTLATGLAPSILADHRTHELSSAFAVAALVFLVSAVMLSVFWFGRLV